MFSLTLVISASVNPAYCFTYCSTPPYLLLSNSRNADIVSGLECAEISFGIGYDGNETDRQENMFSAASLFDANIGSRANRFIIKSRAGSLPTLVKE